MVMYRGSKIIYRNMSDNELKTLYQDLRNNNDFRKSNQLTCLIDYLMSSNRVEAVLS